MNKHIKALAAALFAALLSMGLFACSNTASSSASDQPSTSSSTETETPREDIETVIAQASATDYNNVTYQMKTETSATGTDNDGKAQTQTQLTSMKGELDRSGESPRLHIGFKASSNMQPGKTEYDMYIDKTQMIVEQNGQLYVDPMTDEMLQNYVSSITNIVEEDGLKTILDSARSMKMENNDGDTVISITLDKDKLAESDLVDTSALPENTAIATMVVNYVIDADNHFKAVRLMSSTTGSPTYRVSQSYEYSNYDTTTLPEWPDLDAYAAAQMGITTDEAGNMFIKGDDGQLHQITNIGEDGTVYYDN